MTLKGEAKREYQRKWIKRRRDSWIAENGGKCFQCGSMDGLEVDHINPSEKKYHTRNIWSRTEEVREEELAKCQILCKICHAKKTLEQSYPISHGKYRSGYRRGCRCEECVQCARAYWREYRLSKK